MELEIWGDEAIEIAKYIWKRKLPSIALYKEKIKNVESKRYGIFIKEFINQLRDDEYFSFKYKESIDLLVKAGLIQITERRLFNVFDPRGHMKINSPYLTDPVIYLVKTHKLIEFDRFEKISEILISNILGIEFLDNNFNDKFYKIIKTTDLEINISERYICYKGVKANIKNPYRKEILLLAYLVDAHGKTILHEVLVKNLAIQNTNEVFHKSMVRQLSSVKENLRKLLTSSLQSKSLADEIVNKIQAQRGKGFAFID